MSFCAGYRVLPLVLCEILSFYRGENFREIMRKSLVMPEV
ncbi:Hypothetical protein CpCP13_1639 [Corynebacterium pseudotuberculosis]|nr:Hypothetical protein CpPAT10_1603b [Corynebacterium pseudotuberculosis PAT10]AEP70837.1 Hypothetical protein Cp4202_1593 [Corynebacterium pseudotuberculosis 42/02-A]AER69620.1 Hypothetical protein Cp106_1563 [Corynebacterium pseudotuberculosis 1/06-A]AFF22755.1 Hypothetical protein CpP54B96_1630 [Corynebacterium pseudotuberculosis P54B96]AFH52551.1 Hypothetical protein Cp267_1666 [Corynebacterium pseudotuberculosis 267]AJC14336.1 Hypothetical protein CpVD57_1634 [Corynebacterium pseudotuber